MQTGPSASVLHVANGAILLAGQAQPAPLDLFIENGVIRDLVAPGTPVGREAVRIEAAGMLVSPGFVNAHAHSQHNLSKGSNERWTLELLLNAFPWLGGKRNPEIHYVSALLGAADMVRRGCTAVYDLFSEFPAPTEDGVAAVARAYSDIGMRAVVAPMMADRSFYAAIPGLRDALPPDMRANVDAIRLAPGDESLARCRQILDRWCFNRDRIRPALAPTIPHHCTDDFLRGCRTLANEHGVGLQMHVAESRLQAAVAPRVHGSSAVSHLHRLGLLGPAFTAAHAVWLSEDDARLLGENGCSVAHNPGSNLRLGSGVAAVRRLLDAGVNLAIGTDSAISSDSLNMIEAVRLGALVSRLPERDGARWLSAAEAFRAGTLGGARALGFGDIGQIAHGSKADLVFLDLSAGPFVPLNDAVNQIVFGEDGTAITRVMIDGRIVWENGRHLTIDYNGLVTKARHLAAELRAATRELRAGMEWYAPLITHYCAGLADEAPACGCGWMRGVGSAASA